MKIAIIGSGISGLTCAYLLNQKHDISVFESEAKIGGHTATMNVNHRGKTHDIDTGFIVFNDWTYPNFIKLMDILGVESQGTDMSFSVCCRHTGLEYGGSNLNALFAQRKNLFKPKYLRMLQDILRFNKEALSHLESNELSDSITLGQYLSANDYGDHFIHYYLIPMGSAIWSASRQCMMQFPLLFFVRFFKNHGLLSVNNRPQWRVIKGGSKRYLKPLTESFNDKIKTNTFINHVNRSELNSIEITFRDGHCETFDQVVFACHSDQALKLLNDADNNEKSILDAIPYLENDVVLHTDERLLPASKRAWSSWNYLVKEGSETLPTLSYNMNILQGLQSESTFVVTLNATEKIDPEKIISTYTYAHPQFTLEGREAQHRWGEINGVRNTWFCGAYWHNGFHEDGCSSGIRVAQALGADW